MYFYLKKIALNRFPAVFFSTKNNKKSNCEKTANNNL